MRKAGVVLLSFLAASPLAAQTGTRLSGLGPIMWVSMDTVQSWVLVPGNVAAVYQKAQEVYGALKIKVTLLDSLAGQVGNTGFNQSGSLAGRRMSSWLRCGEGITGPNADSWRVTLAVLSSVERVTKDTTRLRSIVVATARNLAQGSATPMMCATTGQLEEHINLKVQALFSAPSGNE